MKIPKLRLNDKIEIVWLDAYADSGWVDADKAKDKKLPECHSVGYYLTHSKTHITISPDVCVDGDRSAVLIPLGMIQRIRKLKYAQ